jgi:hypothetical protein
MMFEDRKGAHCEASLRIEQLCDGCADATIEITDLNGDEGNTGLNRKVLQTTRRLLGVDYWP